MKKLYLILLTFSVPFVLASQSTPESEGGVNPENTEIFRATEINASFPGGHEEMYSYLSSNTIYPEKAKKHNIEGTVFIEFVVRKNGEITDIEILRSPDEDLSKEAVRVIENMPLWEPGINNGDPVDAFFVLPFRFTLANAGEDKDAE